MDARRGASCRHKRHWGYVMAHEQGISLDRRGFLKAAGATGAAALASGALGGSALADETAGQAWDEECDILVVGYGGAGAAAAITAAEENLGDVLIVEAAPEGDEGGNTRVCGQIIFCPRSVEGAIEYQGNLNAQYKVADDLMQAWAEEITKNAEWLTSIGANPVETPIASPEFPDIAGAEASCNYVIDGTMGNQSLWNVLKGKESELGIRVSYGTRALRLVEEGGEIHGVVAEKDGAEMAIKAKKAVILACGGFENDPEMLSNYHPLGMDGEHVIPLGTPFNRGDGVRMAQRVGAGLWHMNNFSRGGWAMPALCDRDDEFARCGSFPAYASKDYIYVGPNAKRWAYEEATGLTRHGKTEVHGVYMDQQVPEPGYVIVGSQCFEGGRIISPLPYLAAWSMDKVDADGTNETDLERGRIFKGETAAELASQLGLDPDVLTATIEEYNENAANNEDPLFGRGQDYYSSNQDMTGRDNDKFTEGEDTSETPAVDAFSLVPLEPPFYGFPLNVGVLNTQGGPTRSAKGEVTDVDGNPIPRLFAAGELGCIYGYMYNGGGNVGEALASGRIAVRSAAALDAWE